MRRLAQVYAAVHFIQTTTITRQKYALVCRRWHNSHSWHISLHTAVFLHLLLPTHVTIALQDEIHNVNCWFMVRFGCEMSVFNKVFAARRHVWLWIAKCRIIKPNYIAKYLSSPNYPLKPIRLSKCRFISYWDYRAFTVFLYYTDRSSKWAVKRLNFDKIHYTVHSS